MFSDPAGCGVMYIRCCTCEVRPTHSCNERRVGRRIKTILRMQSKLEYANMFITYISNYDTTVNIMTNYDALDLRAFLRARRRLRSPASLKTSFTPQSTIH